MFKKFTATKLKSILDDIEKMINLKNLKITEIIQNAIKLKKESRTKD